MWYLNHGNLYRNICILILIHQACNHVGHTLHSICSNGHISKLLLQNITNCQKLKTNLVCTLQLTNHRNYTRHISKLQVRSTFLFSRLPSAASIKSIYIRYVHITIFNIEEFGPASTQVESNICS